ncbi:MAG: putative motility protein [Lachnospiraceae bacterium]|nr:putative motility protein [Lachnospiraceae bacterium]
MDIPEVSMALANASVLSQVGTAVLSKALDSSRELAAGMAQLMDAAAMELSVNPNVGANFDMRV